MADSPSFRTLTLRALVLVGALLALSTCEGRSASAGSVDQISDGAGTVYTWCSHGFRVWHAKNGYGEALAVAAGASC